jgi:hypothetical protein
MDLLERDHVDDEVEPVRDGERAVHVSVERDVLDATGAGPRALAGERQLPAVRSKGAGDRGPDIAGAAEDERAASDR